MADVVRRGTSPIEYLLSVNTPDYPEASWIINPPSLRMLLATVLLYYIKINVAEDDVEEMDPTEKAAVDAAMLPDQKTVKIDQFAEETRQFVVVQGYDDTAQKFLNGLYTDAVNLGLSNRSAYIKQFLDWVVAINTTYNTAKTDCQNAVDKAALDAVTMDLTPHEATNPDVTPEGALAIPN